MARNLQTINWRKIMQKENETEAEYSEDYECEVDICRWCGEPHEQCKCCDNEYMDSEIIYEG